MDADDHVVYWVNRESAEGEIIWPLANAKPFHVLFTCLQGRLAIPLPEDTLQVGPEQTAFFRADRLRGAVRALEMPVDYQWASFHSPRADRLPLRADRTPFGHMQVLFERLLKSFNHSGGQSRPATFWMRALVRAVLEDHGAREGVRSGSVESVVRSVIQQVDAHPELFWSVADLAARAGYSQTHFCRTFKELTGASPQQYLIQARLSRAQDLLRKTDLTISQIADRLGYRDVYHFSKQFGRRMGLPPSEFRESPPEPD